MDLQTPIKDAGKLFTRFVKPLEKLGIKTLEDFLLHIPSRYDDFTLISKIASVQPGEVVTIQGTVTDISNNYTRRSLKLQKAKVADETGEIDVTWFNQPFIPKTIHKGDTVSLSGRITEFTHKPILESPEYEVMSGNETLHTGRLVPIYPLTHGLTSKWLRRQIYKIIENNKHTLLEHIPGAIIHEHDLMPASEAIKQIHFPESLTHAQRARDRLAFDELFLLQLRALKRRHEWKEKTKGEAFTIAPIRNDIEKLLKTLPFQLTNAQKKAVEEIFTDLEKDKPMNRLLEGDVGSGKTIVAAISLYASFLNGFQSILMAPTEILAQQHHKSISQLLSPLGVKVNLQTGSSKYHVVSSKQKKLKGTLNTEYIIPNTDILIGTHAILSETIQFDKLGLVIIDEQQRFGVEQRAITRGKGNNPHVLSMTATPIPRTVALTIYGDLDLSFLDEMPKGRKEIKTWLVPEAKRESAYEWIKQQIQETHSQVFIICPFIEESESMQTVKAAKKEFERLEKDVFKNFRLALLHGRMKGKEKDTILKAFKEKEYDILVATPVVEVGIDIANATVIVIEAAERFGLAQLHQLRGRVGRGEKQSYCLLFTDSKSPETTKRLKAMETMHVGATLAEYDLHMRGPGEVYGTRQHGQTLLKIANFSDTALIQKARTTAQQIFHTLSDYPLLVEKIKDTSPQKIAPD